VLLAPKGDRGQGRGEVLQALLDRRGWIAHETSDLLEALAELCLLQRTLASRRAWGLTPAEQLALVVVEPRRWPQLAAMLAAARRYVPQASVWSFVDGGLHSLASDRQAEPAGGDAPDGRVRRLRPPAGEGSGSAEAGAGGPRQPADAHNTDRARTDESWRPHISREEIAMLLESERRETQE
jgi:hypothetical protein